LNPKFLADLTLTIAQIFRGRYRVDYLLSDSTPELVEELSKKWEIPKNFMFISSPGEKFSYRVDELGGVRLIL